MIGVVSKHPTVTSEPQAPPMSQRQVTMTMIGLITSIFFAMVSNTVVLTAMPRIVTELHGTQAAYTWIVTSSLLTITVCTPIWGRMSDLLNKKLLIQICVIGYAVSSICAGLAPTTTVMIVCRIGIGIFAAGIIAMIQAISAEIVPPRERARWIGYRGAAIAVATLGAPSLGGVVTDHLGWRWCFGIGVPFAAFSVTLIQYALHLPPLHEERQVRLDWPGAILLAVGVVAMMLWASVAGPKLGWAAPQTLGVMLGGILLICIALLLERRSSCPLLPLELFGQRDVVLCVIAGAGVGIGTFCSAVFLATYLQIGRGLSASIAGLMALPEASGTLVASLIAGHVIARHGRYKRALISGATMVLAGFLLLSTIGTTTPLVQIGLYVALVGGGLGMVSENLILVVQNAVARNTVGSAGALVAFFRSLGAVTCIAVFGAVLSALVASEVRAGGEVSFEAGKIPNVGALAEPLRTLVRAAYAHGVAVIYLLCVPASIVVLGAVSLLHERSLAKEAPRLLPETELRPAGDH